MPDLADALERGAAHARSHGATRRGSSPRPPSSTDAHRRKLVELGLARCRRGRSVATAVEVRSMRFSATATPSVEVIPARVTNTRRAHERPQLERVTVRAAVRVDLDLGR